MALGVRGADEECCGRGVWAAVGRVREGVGVAVNGGMSAGGQ
jgi:hypothetical protein